MVGDIQKIYCSKCERYLFTEKEIGGVGNLGKVIREDDKRDYSYDVIKDVFVCDECNKGNNYVLTFYLTKHPTSISGGMN